MNTENQSQETKPTTKEAPGVVSIDKLMAKKEKRPALGAPGGLDDRAQPPKADEKEKATQGD